MILNNLNTILYIGSLDEQSNSFMRFKTLKRMGYHVVGVDIDKFIYGSVWKSFHYHLTFGPGIKKLQSTVKSEFQKYKPDLVWVDNKTYLYKSTLVEFRQFNSNVKLINVLTDDPFGKYFYSWLSMRKTIKLYDLHFVQRGCNVPELMKHGANQVEMCYRSFDPNFHRKLQKQDFDFEKYHTQVGFIGSFEEERADGIAYLIDHGIELKIIGDGWENSKHWHKIKPFYKGRALYGDEYIKTINGMEVALHFLRKANRDQQDSRTFEIPACGTFMLAERTNVHLEFFDEGVDAEFFGSKTELLQKLKYYLANPKERESIAASGYHKLNANRHNHQSRLEDILSKTFSIKKTTLKFNRIVAGIYYDPDYYPPTINAILNLSLRCKELVVVTRNHAPEDFPYPENVKLIKLGNQISVIETEKKSIFSKIFSFISFTFCLWKQSMNKQNDLLVLYDGIPLLSFFMFKKSLNKDLSIWYHNHDMPKTHALRKYSIGWFAGNYEHKAMEYIDLFSLPSDDRLAYYPNWNRLNNYFLLPNYPSLKVYKKRDHKVIPEEEIRILFQGTIGEGHALEEIISMLSETICGKKIRLILKGSVREAYKNKLNALATTHQVSDRLHWVGLGPYFQLPQLTKTCHIGIAIHNGTDMVRKTLGTASNKIYEYAASGVPVILLDDEQYRKYLENYSWTFFSDGTVSSLKSCIEKMVSNFEQLSIDARQSFETALNYETHFNSAMENHLGKLNVQSL
jgi:spore maturation protein CgeB